MAVTLRSPTFRETCVVRALDVLPDPVPGPWPCHSDKSLDVWTVLTANANAHCLQDASASLLVGIVADAKGWMV